MSLWQRLWGGPTQAAEEVTKRPSLRPHSSLSSATTTEEDNRAAAARVAELQGALARERQRVGQLDQELQAASQLVPKLEQDLEFQEKEQDRIATLQEAFSKRQHGRDVKVEKLLLAVAGEKQLAEERAEELERAQAQLAETRRQREEEQSRRQGEERWLAEREKQLSEAQARLAGGERVRAELQQALLQEQQQLADVLERREATAGELADLRRQRAQDGGGDRDVSDLDRQIHEELTGRQQVQRQIIENMQHLFALEQQLERERGASEPGPALAPGWGSPGVPFPAHLAGALPSASRGGVPSPALWGAVPQQLLQARPGGPAGTPGVATRDLGRAGRESPPRGHQAPPTHYRVVSSNAGTVRYNHLQPGVQSRLDRGSTTFG